MFPSSNEDEDIKRKLTIEDTKRRRTISLYESIFLNILCGLEFLNQKFYPENFYLKDISKFIAKHMDSYTTIFDEIYEKYKDQSFVFPAEIRLMIVAIVDSIMNRLSKILFPSQDVSPMHNIFDNLINTPHVAVNSQ